MERWQTAWRFGIAPTLSVAGLEALRAALAENDRRLMQRQFVYPPVRPMRRRTTGAIHVPRDRPVTGGCAVILAGWLGDGITDARELHDYFETVCLFADLALADCHGMRLEEGKTGPSFYFIEWFDNTPRARMRAELLPEVERELRLRKRRSRNKARREELATVA
ncbi:MAG: hypothetical protein U0804_17145 [Gemmataceae bacterium]